MRINFSKWHGYGNDFVLVSSTGLEDTDPGEFALRVCSPHFGFGADGCVIIKKIAESDFELRIFNQDGSEAGMSGNGCRCAAAQIHRSGLRASSSVFLHASGGKKTFQLISQSDNRTWHYRSEIGEPRFEPEAVPCLAEGEGPVSQFPLDVGDEIIRVNALSLGNPQCAIMVDKLPDEETFERLGNGLERHGFFPQRTNVSFVNVIDRQRLSIRIWERGVGPTLSSGTGSSGAAVTAIRLGLVNSPVTVETFTGEQLVSWQPGDPVVLEGMACLTAEGSFYWDGASPCPSTI
jgi:diaminopimelate epimerase